MMIEHGDFMNAAKMCGTKAVMLREGGAPSTHVSSQIFHAFARNTGSSAFADDDASFPIGLWADALLTPKQKGGRAAALR